MELEMVLRLLLATVLGGVVGYQRGREHKPAGLRTHLLVCLGAALFTLASLHGFGPISDPARVAAGIVIGIGFLGAGTIIQMRQEGIILGLTTAATIWVVAAIGLAAGAGLYLLSIATTIIVVAVLLLRRWF